jgi:hypothetical protein
MNANAEKVKKGLEAYRDRLYNAIDTSLTEIGRSLFNAMCESKAYSGFTGNTQRSYSVGIFSNGRMLYFINGTAKWNAVEVSKKVRNGKTLYLKNPYEGRSRVVTGAVEVDDYYGWQTAQDFIMQQPKIKQGWEIIAGVGTEYYNYISTENIQQFIGKEYQNRLISQFVSDLKTRVSK